MDGFELLLPWPTSLRGIKEADDFSSAVLFGLKSNLSVTVTSTLRLLIH